MRRERRRANLQRIRQFHSSVEVAVDTLVLSGFPSSERYAIGDAFQRELERMFTHAELHSASFLDQELLHLDAGRISLPVRAQPRLVGAQAAQAVYRSLYPVQRRED